MIARSSARSRDGRSGNPESAHSKLSTFIHGDSTSNMLEQPSPSAGLFSNALHQSPGMACEGRLLCTCMVLALGGSGTRPRGLSVAAVSDGAPKPLTGRRRKLEVPRPSRDSDVRWAGVWRGSSLAYGGAMPSVAADSKNYNTGMSGMPGMAGTDLSSLPRRCRPHRSCALTQPSTADPAMIAPLANGDAIKARPNGQTD
jgi:hypothetical protein